MFAKARGRNGHERSSSGATSTLSSPTSNAPPPLVSPVQMNFDFDLPPSRSQSPYRISGESLRRPGTSDGIAGARKSGLSLNSAAPPVLPPIPRVASRYEPHGRARDEADNVSTLSTGSRKSPSRTHFGFEHPVELMPVSGPLGEVGYQMAQEQRPSTSGGSKPKMESSLFPARIEPPVLPPIHSGPPMNRAFIDSRDKPYGQPLTRPVQQLQQSQTMPYLSNSPAMLSLQSPASYDSYSNTQSPISPHLPTPSSANSLRAPKISGARLSPNTSVDDLGTPQRTQTNSTTAPASSNLHTSLSGSTALPSTPSSVSNNKAYSPSAHSPLAQTIGTPYQENSASFPLPQHVATRPKTAGASATVAGVTIPTHHTSSLRPESASGPFKAEKRKTRLLNPMALLSRRKSGQEEGVTTADRSAAAQAYARQKSVAAIGVSKMPADFDPRIKGKVVHDFSAPRQARRKFSYNDAELLSSSRQLQSANSAPSVLALLPVLDFAESKQAWGAASHNKQASEGSSRRSLGSPSMFREMLDVDEEEPDRLGAVNAERLENRDFLQRVSHHSSNSTFSQESSVLPPFARRSQQLDPMQASLYNDVDSKRSSDPSSGKDRDSNTTSISQMSPTTAFSSNAMGHHDVRNSAGQSLSPVSPSSLPADKLEMRPMSAVSDLFSRPSTQPKEPEVRPESTMSNASDLRPKALFHPKSPESRARSESEATARPFEAVGLPQPVGMEAVAEHAIPPRSPYRDSAMAPEVVKTLGPNRDSAMAPEAVTTSGREWRANRDSAMAPEAVMTPDRDSSLASGFQRPTGRLSIPIPDRTSSLGTTPELTPEIVQAETMPMPMSMTRSPPKLVEKRASAVGHARRSSGVVLPRHRVSNASRFSFQFGESPAEERELEEKHRKIKGESADSSPQLLRRRAGSPGDEEDEDEFDESAMDDMDEFEMQQSQSAYDVEEVEGGHDAPLATPSAGLLGPLQQARQQLQVAVSESDDASFYDEDEVPDVIDEGELTYADHPAFRAHSAMAGMHSRDPSVQSGIGQYMMQTGSSSPESMRRPQQQGRALSDESALRVKSNVPSHAGNGFVQDSLSPSLNHVPGGVAGARPRSGFYMQPKAAGYSPTAARSPATEKPPLPHRDSGNSARNRVASGMSFGGAGEGAPAGSASATKSQSQAQAASAGLGLTGFSDFDFGSGPDLTINDSRPNSRLVVNANRMTLNSETLPNNRLSRWEDLQKHVSMGTPPSQGDAARKSYFSSSPENRVQSAAYRGTVGKNIRARNAAVDQSSQYAQSDSEDDGGDDMYFDDGGFGQNVKSYPHDHSVDEDAFDDAAFLSARRTGGLMRPPPNHQRDTSSMSFASVGSDGPYPSFAMGANPIKARQRQSHLLLEDLALQGPVDPRLIPQRNPSEDAKRLGLSSKVPPLPAQEGSTEAMTRMQSNLQAYHASLAEAANRAAAEGRFLRQPSVASTARSLSVYSKDAEEEDGSRYSNDEASSGNNLVVEDGEGKLDRSVSKEPSGSRVQQSNSYSPPKLSFDFGFDSQPLDDGIIDDDLGLDDDIVAAANGDALASEDADFYGQEYGFYAKARPNSGDVLAINGGYFGQDGDDGLARKQNFMEPNLTPITERSEFSTRNSFVNLGHGGAFGLPSAGLHGPTSPALAFGIPSAGLHGPASPALARLPTSLLKEEVTSFDQLRKLRANAFGGSNGSPQSDHGPAKAPGAYAWHAQSPSLSTKSAAAAQGYFGPMGGTPMSFGCSTESSNSSNPSSAHPQGQMDSPQRQQVHDSPQSASLNGQLPLFIADTDVTPRKPQPVQAEPVTAKKVPQQPSGHTRKGSDSVTYVREQDPAGGGQPRWVLERRRTSEQGQLELVGREVVQGGWI